MTFDIGGSVDARGLVHQDIRVASPDGAVRIYIPAGTVVLTSDHRPLRQIQVSPVGDLPVVPDDVYAVGNGYEFGPSGATFNPPIKVAIPYDPSALPETIAPDEVEPAFFDVTSESWVSVGGTVDPTARSVTADVAHFTTFAVLTKHAGVNWLLMVGIVLLEIGLGAFLALMIPRWRRAAAARPAGSRGWFHLPGWVPWQPRTRRPAAARVGSTASRKGDTAHPPSNPPPRSNNH
jgi:hypothetical protein